MLYRARLGGWEGNHWVDLGGAGCCVDIAFPELKLAIEIDGRAFHIGRDAFESDRAKQNALQLAGWMVLRFTWSQVLDEDYLIGVVRSAVVRRKRRTPRRTRG